MVIQEHPAHSLLGSDDGESPTLKTSVSKPFNDLEYTRRELAGELYEIQKHASNGSALENCKCIQEKHLLGVRTEAAEGVTIATDPHEKQFYAWLSPWADQRLDHVLATLDKNDLAAEKAMWKELATETRAIRHEITEETFNIPTDDLRHESDLLSRCIRKAEIRCCGGPTSDYSTCTCNPIQVCEGKT